VVLLEFPLKPKIIELLKNNPKGLTIAGISERLNVSRHTVSITLAEMYGEKLITVTNVGMAKLIYLNESKLNEIEKEAASKSKRTI
jgi:Mn-dependent DtxR family transcriptional regulator